MFAKTIIDSDAFLEMPISARLLYYDLGMRADDDGFVNSPKKIMKFIGASLDDMNILILRKFILPFDSGVVVIKHWRIHNYIRKDTYNETNYKSEKSMLELDENKAYKLLDNSRVEVFRGLSVDEQSTQVRLGKVSIDKNSIDQDNINNIVQKSSNETAIIVSKKVSDKQLEEEFDKLWEHYPKKRGKEQAKNKYILARKQGTTYEEIAEGLKRFIIYCKAEKIEEKFIKHGSTWFNQKCWQDEYKISDNSKTKKNNNQNEILKGIYNGTFQVN